MCDWSQKAEENPVNTEPKNCLKAQVNTGYLQLSIIIPNFKAQKHVT